MTNNSICCLEHSTCGLEHSICGLELFEFILGPDDLLGLDDPGSKDFREDGDRGKEEDGDRGKEEQETIGKSNNIGKSNKKRDIEIRWREKSFNIFL